MNRVILISVTFFIVTFILEKVWEKSKKEQKEEKLVIPTIFSRVVQVCMYVSVVGAVVIGLCFGKQALGISILFIILAFLCMFLEVGLKRYCIEFKKECIIYTPVFGKRKKILYTDIKSMVPTIGGSINLISIKGKKIASIDEMVVGYKEGIEYLKNKGIPLE